MSIKIDDLAKAVMDELQTYEASATAAAKDAVRKVAKDCRTNISNSAPKESGKYSKSWRTKEEYNSATELRIRVYSTKYQLTHLLEYGHDKWLWGHYTGGRVDPKPHIRPAERRAEEDLMRELKRGL